MVDPITPAQFHQAEGVGDWQAVGDGVVAHFLTGTFATGVRLILAIGELADSANHHPDIDLRYKVVTVRLTTHDVGGLSDLDVELAQDISSTARVLGIPADRAQG